MERVAVIGTSGAGKTTLARHLADALSAPHLELDAVYHQPGWVEVGHDEFRARVAEFCAQPRWVTCGKHGIVRDILLDRADTIVCVDHDRLRQTTRVYVRSWRRAIAREELFNGNREPLHALWPVHPDSVTRWAWRNIPRVRRLFDRVEADARPDQTVVRLRGWRQVDAFRRDVQDANAGARDANQVGSN